MKQYIRQQIGQEEDYSPPKGEPYVTDNCHDTHQEEAGQEEGCGKVEAASLPQKSKDVSTANADQADDGFDDYDDQGAAPGADDCDNAKTQGHGDRHSGAATHGTDVKATAEDVQVKIANPAHAPEQLAGSDGATKRRARRRFRRRRVVILRQFDAADRE